MTSARDLTDRLASLLRDEHAALADFIALLSDFDRRRLWLELGYSSLFVFLVRELRLSKGSAHYRKTAAELAQRVPEILDAIRDGRLCLTVVVELARVLTPENRADVLPRFFHLSRQEAMEVVAELSPRPAPPLRQVTTAVRSTAPARASADAVRPDLLAGALAAGQPERGAAERPEAEGRADPCGSVAGFPENLLGANISAERSGTLPQEKPTRIEPLTKDLRRLHVTVSRRLLDKLAAARDALSHSMPGATDDEIIEAGLDLILAAQAKRKGIVKSPRKEPPPSNGDDIPAHVRRAVWIRDEGKCRWPTADGGICGSTLRVEFAHRFPKARGGLPTVDEIRLLCCVHNQYEAELDFGAAHQERYRRRRRDPLENISGEQPSP